MVGSEGVYLGDIAVSTTIPPSKAKARPRLLTTMASGPFLGTFLFVCNNVSFSRSPVSATVTANA